MGGARAVVGFAVVTALGGLAGLPVAAGARSADIAALQVALHATGDYAGDVDGIAGPGTAGAVRAFQRRHGLPPDGVAGPLTRRALGRRGRPAYGSRVMRPGSGGWDVAALQFKLAVHGFPSGPMDGGFAARTLRAVVRFQRWAGLTADGLVGSGTRRALRGPPPRPPFALRWPVRAPLGDRYGPRGVRFHAGVDFTAPLGAPVAAAAAGRVTFAGYAAGGWGRLVILDHGGGVRTLSAHLSTIAVRPGWRVPAGALIGRVGATGYATGPHLHFEVAVRGAKVDPALALA